MDCFEPETLRIELSLICPICANFLREKWSILNSLDDRKTLIMTARAMAAQRHTPYYYPITIDLEYRLLSLGEVVKIGRGRTTRLASTCLQFESGDHVPPGRLWKSLLPGQPRLNNAVSLQLYLLGRVVPSTNHGIITVEIQRYEFHTRSARYGIVGQPVRSRAKAANAWIPASVFERVY